MRKLILFSLFLVLGKVSSASADLPWRSDLSPKEFQEASSSNKLILLNLEAIWCHWCHVMAEETYANPKVASILTKNYVLVKIDQDSRPDLSNRYQDHGWPATIILNGKGEDLRKFSGFVEPGEFATALEEAVKNPKPEERKKVQYQTQGSLTDAVRSALLKKLDNALDREKGGLNSVHKYLEIDTAEYLLRRASKGDAAAKEQVLKTLKANENLLDPVWGGIYQYSVHSVWTNPHYEKLITNQSDNIRMYSLAARIFPEERERFTKDALKIYEYVESFLKAPDGTFYTSQDADVEQGKESSDYRKLDDAGRRAKGIPRVDKNVYADRNGRMVRALVSLYRLTGEAKYLAEAETAVNKIAETRGIAGGGFQHGEKKADGPYLADSLYMAIAYGEIYAVTGERSWLKKAEETAQFVSKKFAGAEAGLLSSPPVAGVIDGAPHIAENIDAARFFNMLARFSGKEDYKGVSQRAMRFLGTEDVATDSLTEIGIVTADEELGSEPVHVTIVAAKGDDTAKSLFKTAIGIGSAYLRTEWWDKSEGPMPNPDVQYPSLPKPAAFVCAERRCSLPIFKAEDILKRVKEFGAA